jgi:hypothetical protein
MNEEIIPKKMIITQLEEALEERQKPERRSRKAGLPPDVKGERRKGDRRTKK